MSNCVLDKLKSKGLAIQQNMRLALNALSSCEKDGILPPTAAAYIRWMLRDTQKEVEAALGVPPQEEK